MSTTTKTIFISHDSRNKLIVDALASLIHKKFPTLQCQYSSADLPHESVQAGKSWRDWIHEQLETAAVVLCVLTPCARRNQWVMYEAGLASGIKPAHTIPILAGIGPNDIPGPLTNIQAVELAKRHGIAKLLRRITELTGSRAPLAASPDIDDFLTSIALILEKQPDPDWLRRVDNWAEAATELRFRKVGLDKQIALQFEQVLNGCYTIVGPSSVYKHDAAIINSLDKGDFYYATHPFSSNPGVMEHRRRPDNFSFHQYVSAQLSAARRGVEVVRLYVVDNVDSACTATDVSTHLKELHDAGVRVMLTPAKLFKDDDNVSDDFVLMGNYSAGVALPHRGPMQASMYMLHMGANAAKYKQYLDYFQMAVDLSTPFAP